MFVTVQGDRCPFESGDEACVAQTAWGPPFPRPPRLTSRSLESRFFFHVYKQLLNRNEEDRQQSLTRKEPVFSVSAGRLARKAAFMLPRAWLPSPVFTPVSGGSSWLSSAWGIHVCRRIRMESVPRCARQQRPPQARWAEASSLRAGLCECAEALSRRHRSAFL